MKSPSFTVICRTVGMDFDCCWVFSNKWRFFLEKNVKMLFVLQPEGAAVDAGLLGTKPEAAGGRAHV